MLVTSICLRNYIISAGMPSRFDRSRIEEYGHNLAFVVFL